MTPKEKCDELIKQFKPLVQFKMGVEQSYVLKMAKQCALITVNEILNNWKDEASIQFPYGKVITYWSIVKEEIEEL